MAHKFDREMYNIDPCMKRRKQTRVRKQLVKANLQDESEENSLIEVQQKVTKKYQNYLHTLRKMADFDWTDIENTNNSKVIYPIQFLQASTLQFMIAALYFNCDQEYLQQCLHEIEKILKKNESIYGTQIQDDCKKQKNKKVYDVNDDIFILEMRNLGQKDLDDLITTQEIELEQITKQNEGTLQQFVNLVPTIKQHLKTDQQNNLLRDIAGLTETEKQYIEKTEMKIQADEQTVVVQETGKKTQGGGIHLQPNLDDALCQVCNDGDYTDDNLIVFCSKCNISVHQKCYLIDIIPNEDWICDVCQTFGPNGQYLRCALCPKLGGAMKATQIDASCFQNLNQTYFESQGETMMKNDFVSKLCNNIHLNQVQQIDDDQELYYDFGKLPNRDIRDLENNKEIKELQPQKVWIHLSCFYWSPECFLDEKQDILRGVDNINAKRFALNCSICNIKKAGMCIQCARGSCATSFHVECARRSGIFLTQTVINNKPDYQIFCQKHVPLKVKRILESKQRLYEREIIDFFRAYEKCRQVHKKSVQKPKKLKANKEQKLKQENQENTENEFDLIDFANKLKEFINQITDQQLIVNLKFEQGQYGIESIQGPVLKPQKQYKLTILPEVYQNKVDANGLLVTQFYKSTITATDELWKHFKYRDYEKDITYKMYEKLRRRASKYMQEINPQKKQAKLIDILMLKKYKKNNKAELKKEIVIEQVGDEFFQRDDNLYCVCRGKFKDGDPMICCEVCDEWFHFDCLEMTIPFEEASQIEFKCFLCVDDLPQNERVAIHNIQSKIFKDSSFKLQRELAEKCKLDEQRRLRLKDMHENKLKEEQDFEIDNHQIQLDNKLQIEDQNNQEKQCSQEELNISGDNQFQINNQTFDQDQIQIEIQLDGNEKNKKSDDHVKTPSKTESVEDQENHKLEVPETQEKVNNNKFKQKSIRDYFQKLK